MCPCCVPSLQRMPARSRATLPGFSLVELLVWLAIAGLLATAGYGMLGPFAQERKLRAAVDRVVAALEFGRDVARYEGRSVAVEVVPDHVAASGNTVRLTYVDDGGYVLHPLTKNPYVVQLDHESLQGVRVKASNADGDHTVEFDPHGEPVDATSRFTLEYSGRTRIVRVEPHSGRVTVGSKLLADTPVDTLGTLQSAP